MRISVGVDERTWKRLRDIAERQRDARGRASVAALMRRALERLIVEADAVSK